jgi:acetate kinase
MTTKAVLVINSGSSSIKFAAFAAFAAIGDRDTALLTGKISGIGRAPDFIAHDPAGNELHEGRLENIKTDAGHGELVEALLDWLQIHHPEIKLVAAGHRVVHGGQEFTGPVLIDQLSLQKMADLTPLAPLHQPHNLAAVSAIAKRAPDMAQVACFDTSFHRTQPRLAQLFAIPHKLTDEGIIRYGFHGLSYEYIASMLPELLGDNANGKVIIAHLGNGASICALKDRQSVATSMGFTALHGLMMGRRCGTLDAGAVLHLLQQRQMTFDEVHHLLYRQSGLLGVSGFTNNMKELQDSDNPRAKEAVDLFCYRAAGEFASHAAALQGLQAIVFTGGIGENSAHVRQQICQQLAWMGTDIDEKANNRNARTISAPDAKISVHVIATNEELVIARATRELTAES